MKKFLALFTVIMLLVAAGSAFAAGHDGTGTDEPSYTPPTPGGSTPSTPGGTDTPGEEPGGETPGGETQPSIGAEVVTTAPAVASLISGNSTLVLALLGSLGLPDGVSIIDNSTLIVGAQTPVATAQAAFTALTAIFRNAASAVVAFVLPAMSSPRPGVVLVGLPQANIGRYRGRRMSFVMVPKGGIGRRSAGFSAAGEDDEVQKGQFIGPDGNVIDGPLPETGDISVSSYMKANVEYDPMIVEGTLEDAAEEPGGEQPGGETPGGETPGGETPGGETPGGETPGGETPGGETPGGETPGGETPGGNNEQPGGTDEPGTEDVGDIGGSGGGCDAGFGALAMAALAGFVARKR